MTDNIQDIEITTDNYIYHLDIYRSECKAFNRITGFELPKIRLPETIINNLNYIKKYLEGLSK